MAESPDEGRAANPDAYAETVAPPSSTDLRGIESSQTVAAPSRPGGAAAPEPLGSTAPAAAATTPRPLPEVGYDNYRHGQEIARGGMGKIVAAEDARLDREVALKVLLGPAGDQLERFQREALITARLQHPGIVPVYEAGRWPSGEPFFAMKRVHGKPLDEVIARAHTLDARLALLPHVVVAAEAIAYAHTKHIVHRDLKPANVLVGDFGETVVIDWGLAKDLQSAETSVDRIAPRSEVRREPTTTASTLTVAGAVMGTPAYMAPEQARGEPVDERVDVFALGAMVYHLLAGTPPYRARTATDVIAAAALGRVVPLAEHVRRAPPDLVAIVDRAMAQEPRDRYANAGEVAKDLRRFLTGQLVAAHHYTAWQRVARFVRKHRAAVTIGAIAVTALGAGATLAIRDIVAERDRADAERDIAVIRKRAAEQLIDDTIGETTTQLRAIGRLEVLAHLGNGLSRYFDRLDAIRGGLSRDDVARMAEAIALIGEAEQKAGKPDDALASWLQARERLEVAIALPSPSDPVEDVRRRRRVLARLDFEIATNYQQRGRIADAMKQLDAAEQVYAALRDDDPTDKDVLLGDADARDRLGDLLRNAGKVDDALGAYTAAKSDREAAVALGGDAAAARRALATSHLELGSAMFAHGDTAAAFAEVRAAIAVRSELVKAEPANLELAHELLDADDTLGDLQRQSGDDAGAIATYEAARPVVAGLIARDPGNQVWRRTQGIIDADLGMVRLERGDFRAGLDALGRAIELLRAAAAADPASTFWRVDLSRALARAGDAHGYLGELDDAVASYRESLELRAALVARDNTSVPWRRALAWSHALLGDALGLRGDRAGAIAEHEQALALRGQLVDESPTQRGFRDELAQTELALGRALVAGDAAAQQRGAELVARGLGRARDDVDADRLNTDWQTTLAAGLLASAEVARVAGDRAARGAALVQADGVAESAAGRAPQNAHLPGYVAEARAGMAELATTPAAARAEWDKARLALAGLAATNRLPASRRALLDRAIAGSR